MFGLDNIFAPAQGPQPDPQAAAGGGADIAGQWRNWMAEPDNRAALMQFGIAMMQPVGLGQSPMGHVGQSLGQAGETVQRRQTERRAQEEASSRQDLRTAQAGLAEARADNAGVRAGRQADQLGFQRERLAVQQRLGMFQRQIQAANGYERYRQQYEQGQALVPASQRQPVLSREQWYSQSGFGDLLGAQPEAPSADDAAAPAGGGGTAPVRVRTPAEAQALAPGTRYVTPDGRTFTR